MGGKTRVGPCGVSGGPPHARLRPKAGLGPGAPATQLLGHSVRLPLPFSLPSETSGLPAPPSACGVFRKALLSPVPRGTSFPGTQGAGKDGADGRPGVTWSHSPEGPFPPDTHVTAAGLPWAQDAARSWSPVRTAMTHSSPAPPRLHTKPHGDLQRFF